MAGFDRSLTLVLEAYLRAYQYRPSRIEPLYQVARYYRETGQYHLGRMFARTAVETPFPDDLLFIERAVYESKAAEEHARCCRGIDAGAPAGSDVEGIQGTEGSEAKNLAFPWVCRADVGRVSG